MRTVAARGLLLWLCATCAASAAPASSLAPGGRSEELGPAISAESRDPAGRNDLRSAEEPVPISFDPSDASASLDSSASSASSAQDPCTIDSDGDGTVDCLDGCPNDANKIAPGVCGCGTPDTDSDNDGTPDCNDGCPNDANKIAPGVCGCGTPETDSDGDGTPNCNDGCPNDPDKITPGVCGCGTPDTDSDNDGTPNCNDGCPNDPNKTAPGVCGCGTPDTDSDNDGSPNCIDGCPNDPDKITPGVCGCGTADTDSDNDGTPNCNDGCPNDPDKITPGVCGCGTPDTDSDNDGTPNCNDGCPNDPNKTVPGVCGCGTPDTDSDNDGTPNCNDECPNDPNKTVPGVCGCGTPDTDSDNDGTPNCNDGCPNDPNKIAPGVCGCGTPETDSDGDGTPNCIDGCPNDPNKIAPGVCGCGTAETDGDGDGTPNCIDGCPNDPNKIAPGMCGCGTAETDGDGDGTPNCIDGCPNDPDKIAPGVCGCGTLDTDSDNDGTPNCTDGCPNDPNKIAPGVCGCGLSDNQSTFYRDADGDGYGNPNLPLVACSAPSGYVSDHSDCNDNDFRVNPGRLEVCGNQIDDDCDGAIDENNSGPNRIVLENLLPGNPRSEWDIAGAGDPSIQGFATEFSINHGETAHFKIQTPSVDYRLDIYRLGFYAGAGARLVATVFPSVALPQTQPDCMTDPSLGLVDCGNWTVSAAWPVPPDATSGIFFARLVRQDPPYEGAASHVYFVVRDDESCDGILYQTSDSTWQAYNSYGGASLYVDHRFGLPGFRAYKVSYNRPFITRGNVDHYGLRSFLFNAEYPMIRWLEANGYRVAYSSGIDTARHGMDLLHHQVFMSCGHDEYWSGVQRANVEAARDSGVSLAFFSGNECFWKTRWEPSISIDETPYRTLVCFKDTAVHQQADPLPGSWTGTWRDPRFSPPADGGRPENAMSGTIYGVNGGPLSLGAIRVPAADGRMRLWRNTTIALLPPDQEAVLSDATLGHEWDEDLDNGFRPAGLVRMSTTRKSVNHSHLHDFGTTYGPGQPVHHLTLYRAASRALVFGAGTIQWSWGLDGNHDNSPSVPDLRMQQATVNLLADQSVTPATLQPGLVPASQSTDVQPATSFILRPGRGATVPSEVGFEIIGRASDTGGGVVGGVEVSIDGGAHWYAAEGREQWRFRVPPGRTGPIILACRAADDSANLQPVPFRVHVRRVFALSQAQAHIFHRDDAPTKPSSAPGRSTEVGVKFRSDIDGFVTGVRFYKGPGNTGTHFGHLWTANGLQLAAVQFVAESESGWQEASFSAPVNISAHTTYIVSYFSQTGSTAADARYFTERGVDNPPLHALRAGVEGGNGVYRLGPMGFPNLSGPAVNYWVDVSFASTPTPPTTPGH